MRTTDDNDQAVGRVEGQGKLAELECAGFVGGKSEQMYIRCDIRVLVHQLEIGAEPSRAKLHPLRWRTGVVALFRRERGIFPIQQPQTLDRCRVLAVQ